MRCVKGILTALLIVLGLAAAASAMPPEDLVTKETMTAQSLSDQEIVSPYTITGESLVTLVRHMVSFEVEGSTAIFNRNTGQLFVRNTPQNQEDVGRILTRIRDAYKQQIEIHAQIITVSSTDFDGLGVHTMLLDASMHTDDSNYGRIGTDIGFLEDNVASTFADFANIADANASTGQFSFGVLSDGFRYEYFFDAISSKAEVNTLSSPRIIVTNNQRAHIRFKKAEYYVREVESEATTGETPVITLKPTLAVAESGTILDVTPTVNADGSITLELHPTFVRADLSSTKTINVAPTSVLEADKQPFVTLPVFTNQQADTTLTVTNGGTAVIGGFVGETEIVKHRNIPILSQIPIVNRFSGQETRSEARSYLIMFVKAAIRNPQRSFAE